MTIQKVVRTLLIWLPSIIVSVFYMTNAFGKIFLVDQADKVIQSSVVIVSVGIVLLVSNILFLINKTLIWGTLILSMYMSFITFIHIYKGKPFEVTMLIVVSTILAAYLRKPEHFKTS